MQDKHPNKKSNVAIEEKDTQKSDCCQTSAKANDANAVREIV
jgi:hypothetical protein